MALQKTAANGEKLPHTHILDDVVLRELGINLAKPLPQGLVGFDIDSGLATVINKPDSKGVQIRIGKFLKKLGKPEAEVTLIGNNANKLKQLAKMPLKFTSTSEEVISVYQKGPSSCMGDCDAVGVYATEDVAVAYLEYDGEVLARSVVCKNPEIGLYYVRAYGLVDVIEASLNREGYSCGTLEGCKLLKIEEDGGYSMPYLDGIANSVDVGEEFMAVTECGEFECDTTDGHIGTVPCGECGEATLVSEICYSEYMEMTLCETCNEENHVYVDGGTYHKEDEGIQLLEDNTYVLADNACHVEERDEYHHIDDCTYNNYSNVYHVTTDLGID